MPQKLKRQIRLIDRLIVSVGILGFVLFIVHGWTHASSAKELILPQPFVLSQTENLVMPPVLSSTQVSIRELSLAESCLIEGSRLWDHGSYSRAELWLRRSVAISHGNQRYTDAFSQFEKHLQHKKIQREIITLFRSGEKTKAWKSFANEASQDPKFFVITASTFARQLGEAGQISSAVAILQTYCDLKPQDTRSKALFEQLLVTLRKEQKTNKAWYEF